MPLRGERIRAGCECVRSHGKHEKDIRHETDVVCIAGGDESFECHVGILIGDVHSKDTEILLVVQ